MNYIDLNRVQTLLVEKNLDGLLALSPENFEYVSAVSGFPVTMWRRGGPASALISASGRTGFVIPETAHAAVRRANPRATLASYPLWIERVDVEEMAAQMPIEERIALATAGRLHTRPETYDPRRVDDLLGEMFHQFGLAQKRVGVDMEFVPAADMARLRELLPDVAFVNASSLIRELRLIKTGAEIEILRRGVAITERGITGALVGLDERTLAADLRTRFIEACSAAARQQRELGFQSAATGVHLGPLLWDKIDPTRAARRGDIVQFDSSVQIRGYKTDIGRTFTFGPASDAQRRIQDALLAGFAAGLERLRPGERFCDLFFAVQDAVRAAGFPSYARGHVGHSIGSDVDGEEWPWFSATETRILEPGMVVAFEVPYYVNGVGGFQNEDDLLITESGHESFNTLPLALGEV
ncbi:MAG: aminopeptidase P family protein [Caldilineaceae bacterium]|nr:aminopeptidase P family protein [Caldilineaceae bacterium]